jgi:hypothetical protein
MCPLPIVDISEILELDRRELSAFPFSRPDVIHSPFHCGLDHRSIRATRSPSVFVIGTKEAGLKAHQKWLQKGNTRRQNASCLNDFCSDDIPPYGNHELIVKHESPDEDEL